MKELKDARRRLAWEIEKSEERIDYQYNQWRDMFTLGYVWSTVVDRVGQLRTWAQTFYDGFHLMMSMFKRPQEPEVVDTTTVSEQKMQE